MPVRFFVLLYYILFMLFFVIHVYTNLAKKTLSIKYIEIKLGKINTGIVPINFWETYFLVEVYL